MEYLLIAFLIVLCVSLRLDMDAPRRWNWPRGRDVKIAMICLTIGTCIWAHNWLYALIGQIRYLLQGGRPHPHHLFSQPFSLILMALIVVQPLFLIFALRKKRWANIVAMAIMACFLVWDVWTIFFYSDARPIIKEHALALTIFLVYEVILFKNLKVVSLGPEELK